MTTPTIHPDRLFWFVAGALERDEAQLVQAHLGSCADCRSIVQTLQTLSSTVLVETGPGGHPPPEFLDTVMGGGTPLSALERQDLEVHLSRCATCRDDLERLGRTYRTDPVAPVRVNIARRPAIRRWALAACLVVALAPAVWWLFSPPDQPIVLMPAIRSANQSTVLAGTGPWRVLLVPPSQASPGVYSIWIERPDGSIVAELPSVENSGDGAGLLVEVPRLAVPGAYRLALNQQGAGPDALQLYPFRVGTDRDD